MGQRLPDLLTLPRTAKLAGCSMPSRAHLADDMARLGLEAGPFHLLLPSRSECHIRGDVRCHRHREDLLQSRSLIRLSKSMLIVSPELLFLELAATGEYDEIDLALIGFELCGTYVLDESWDGFTNTSRPVATRHRLMSMINRSAHHRGVKLAARAARLVIDNSHSPMETVMAMLFCLPHRYGGMGFKGAVLNYKVETAEGSRWVDAAFPTNGFGLEYQGRRYHSQERVGRDARRQARLIGAGLTTVNVWYEDLADLHLFEQLARDVACALGVRLRPERTKNFSQKRTLLRSRILPSLSLSSLDDM